MKKLTFLLIVSIVLQACLLYISLDTLSFLKDARTEIVNGLSYISQKVDLVQSELFKIEDEYLGGYHGTGTSINE